MSASRFVTQGKKIIGIGRNYLDHVKELKNEVPPKPFFFLKPTSSYLIPGNSIEIPQGIICHHEVELGVVIGKQTRSIKADQALESIAGYALAVDLTARNVQEDVRREQLPWSSAKGFDTFCPIGKFIPSGQVLDPHNLDLWLKVNGKFKQQASTQDMLFKIPELIAHCSGIMTLEEGDLILTGTPAGVSQIVPGDEIEAGLKQSEQSLDEFKFKAVEKKDGLTYEDLRL